MEEYQGSERTKKMKVLNLRREFEALQMKETKTVRDFSDRISKVVTQIRLLGEDLSDQRVEENKNFSEITLQSLLMLCKLLNKEDL